MRTRIEKGDVFIWYWRRQEKGREHAFTDLIELCLNQNAIAKREAIVQNLDDGTGEDCLHRMTDHRGEILKSKKCQIHCRVTIILKCSG